MKIIFFILICLPTFLMADTSKTKVMVMVNLNYSKEELDALNEVAIKRGQKLYLIPDDSKTFELAQTTSRLRSQIESLLISKFSYISEDDRHILLWKMKNYEPGDEKRFQGTSEDILKLKDLMSEYAHVYKQVDVKEASRPSIKNQIIQLQNKLAKNNESADTLVISGHSGFGGFGGETNLVLPLEDFDEISSTKNNIFSNPRHVLLMGCYSNTLTAKQKWRNPNYFKNATLIGGFGGRAPLRTQRVSSNYIKETLNTADQIDRSLILKDSNVINPEYIKKLFQSLKSVQSTFSAIDYCGIYMNRAPALVKDCELQWLDFNTFYLNTFRNFIGDTKNIPAEDPPKIKSSSRNNPPSKLREIYNNIQAMCPRPNRINDSYFDVTTASEKDRDTAISTIIRAIFWWDIQHKYQAAYKNQISDLYKTFIENQIDIKLPNLDGSLGRIDFLKAMNNINLKIEEQKAKDKESKECREKNNCLGEKLQSQFQSAYQSLISLDDKIPASWL